MILHQSLKAGGWVRNSNGGGSNTSKGISAQFVECDFKVNPDITSHDQTAYFVDSRGPRPGMCSRDVHPAHPLHGDNERVGGHRQAAQEYDLRIQQAHEVCGFAERFRPGCWNFRRPRFFKHAVNFDSWSCLAPQFSSRKTSIRKREKYSIHSNTSTETFSMVCNLTESVNMVSSARF